MSQRVSWIHFGDLHIVDRDEQNYRDFLALIDEAGHYMNSGIDFAFLPGDNADDGEEHEYRLVKEAIRRSRFPVHAITGDHDIVSGNLNLFRRYLADPPHRTFAIGAHRFLFLNSVAHWHPPVFGLGGEQMSWLRDELHRARRSQERIVVFMHAYPSEHGNDAAELAHLFREANVWLVEMGHTHYNELANDGQILYATTRSTGQIEEGPVGFSVTTLDAGVFGWKFKPLGEWPLVMVTAPSDRRLIVDPGNPMQVVRDSLEVRARVWGASIENVTLFVDEEEPVAMEPRDACTWQARWNRRPLADGSHRLMVIAQTSDGLSGEDNVTILVNRRREYTGPARRTPDYENAIAAWPEKGILGTQLGPNENGHPWPPRRKRTGLSQ
jgi:Icc protein